MRGKYNGTYPVCAKEGCKARAMKGGDGFCFWHRVGKDKERKEMFIRAAQKRKMGLTPERKCAVERCKLWRKKEAIYCAIHLRLMTETTDGSDVCKEENCHSKILVSNTGYCFWHSPLQAENRNRRLIKLEIKRKDGTSKERCRKDGCRVWPMRDGSGFCYSHNPALEEKRGQVAKLRIKRVKWAKVPPERKCKFKGCKGWAKTNGSGLCFHHQPNIRLKQKYSLLGTHRPWLGLKDINEARGLIFYSLETNQPLLTLRALTKIVSLHARGEIYTPGKFGIKDEQDKVER